MLPVVPPLHALPAGRSLTLPLQLLVLVLLDVRIPPTVPRPSASTDVPASPAAQAIQPRVVELPLSRWHCANNSPLKFTSACHSLANLALHLSHKRR